MSVRLSITAEGAMFAPHEQHRLLDVVRAAEACGADMVDVSEHVLMGEGALHAGQGWEPRHLEQPQPEALSTLAAFAGATTRIGLLSSIVIAPLRPAGLLAKTAATLHALSRGRFVMGVTASWHQDEYEALGVPFAERGQVLTETVAACRALWDYAPASFHGAFVNFDGMHCSPRPAPGERIPVWFGGKFTERNIRRVVDLGDGWMPWGGLGMSTEDKAAAVTTLRERFRAAGRDPWTLEVCDGIREVEGSVARSLAGVPDLVAAGVTVVRVNVRRFLTSADQAVSITEEVCRRFDAYR